MKKKLEKIGFIIFYMGMILCFVNFFYYSINQENDWFVKDFITTIMRTGIFAFIALIGCILIILTNKKTENGN